MQSKINISLVTTALLAATSCTSITFGQSGTIVAWGRDTSGEISIPPTVGPVRQVAAGGDWHGGFTTCLRNDGSVTTWGSNLYEVLNTPPNLEPCRAISAGWYHIMVLTEASAVRAWGFTGPGAFWTVPSDLGTCTAIAAGYLHSLAIRSDGRVCGWGNNDFGGPSSVPADLGTCRDIAASYYYSSAITTPGMVRSWGSNESGQLEIPSDLLPCKRIAAGAGHQLVLQVNGSVRAWGTNFHGQCAVPPDLRECSQIAAGLYHSLALQTDGIVRAWGLNSHLQSTVPDDLAPIMTVAAGGFHSTALEASPVVLAVQPISAPSEGGTRVTIVGNHFRSTSRVWFDGVEATQILFESTTRIHATTPPGFPGESTVTVDSGSARAFYYRPYCGSDLDNSGSVDAGDIAIILLDFGPCYPTETPVEADSALPFLLQDEAAPNSRAR